MGMVLLLLTPFLLGNKNVKMQCNLTINYIESSYED